MTFQLRFEYFLNSFVIKLLLFSNHNRLYD